MAVPRFADFATVELLEPVLRGEEPPGDAAAMTEMRRTALSGLRPDQPLQPVGDTIHFDVTGAPMAVALDAGHAVVQPGLAAAEQVRRAQDPEGAARALAYGMHSLLTVPLLARGVVLGMANFWRADTPEPFGDEDLSFAEELAARAAVAIDNARRFTREHAMAVTLQRSLLPRVLPDQSAVEVAYRYLPAKAGVGGDWFDVIPLPGARVALVVGDVVGHGLHVVATMGRLRTAVHNFSTLDVPPDELLGHLDELTGRIDHRETEGPDAEGGGGKRASRARPACTRSTTRLPVGARWRARVPDRRSSARTDRWSSRNWRRGCRWGSDWETCPSRRRSCDCRRAASWCSSRTGSWRTGGGTWTRGSRCWGPRSRARTGARSRPARTSWRRCSRPRRATTSRCSWRGPGWRPGTDRGVGGGAGPVGGLARAERGGGEALGVGARRARLHGGADPQRADHERGAVRRRPGPGACSTTAR
ncbi:hypothetical protein SNARM312S_07974 [Streptomyces narbonensis]